MVWNSERLFQRNSMWLIYNAPLYKQQLGFHRGFVWMEFNVAVPDDGNICCIAWAGGVQLVWFCVRNSDEWRYRIAVGHVWMLRRVNIGSSLVEVIREQVEQLFQHVCLVPNFHNCHNTYLTALSETITIASQGFAASVVTGFGLCCLVSRWFWR
jgi:hypothetical protein